MIRRWSMCASVLLFYALLWAAPSWAYTVVFTANGSTTVWSASVTGTVTISAAAGDWICVGTDVQGSSRTMTITDNRGGGSNTYTRMATREIASSLEIWNDCTVTDASVTEVTGTISSTIGTASHMYVWVISGGAASIGTPNAVTAESTSGTAHNPGTLTITGASALYLGVSVHAGTGSFTIDADYTSRYSQTGIIVGDDEVTANADMANTTGGNRVSISYLVEVPPSAGGGLAAGELMLLGVGK